MARKLVFKGNTQNELIETLMMCGFAPTQTESVMQDCDKRVAHIKAIEGRFRAYVTNNTQQGA